MLLLWDYEATDEASLVTDSEVATLPAVNVQHSHLARQWYTLATVTAAYIIFDMGASVARDVVALLGTNLTPTGTIRVRASDADPTCVGSLLRDTGALTGAAKAGYGAVYKQFATATARYWRIDISDAAVAEGQLRIGRAVLGPSWEPAVPQLFDWSVATMDESVRDVSYGGQEWFDQRPQRRVLSFILDYMPESEGYGQAFALTRAAGLTRDILAIPDIDGTYLSEQAVWGTLSASEPVFHRLPQIYRQKFTVKERL